jgi:hypothetical protein
MNASARSTAPTVFRPYATVVFLGCLLLPSTNESWGATPVVTVHPCSLLTLEEVGSVVHGTATQDRPHVVAVNKVPVGGDCTYRSVQNKSIVINLMVDAYPGGHQQNAFENGRRRPHVTDLPGLGDRAFTVTNPQGPATVTFIQGMILVTIHAEGLGIDDARQLATRVSERLAETTGASAPPVSSPPVQPTLPTSQDHGEPGSPVLWAGSCDAVLGQWTWFTGGVVTIKADGTMAYEQANDGTWECTDAARGEVTLRWRLGGFINRLAPSPDGRDLSSTDPSQPFVTARRSRGGEQ